CEPWRLKRSELGTQEMPLKELIDRRRVASDRKLESVDRVSGVKRKIGASEEDDLSKDLLPARGDDEASPSDFPAAPCKAAVEANSRNRSSPNLLIAEHQVRLPVRQAENEDERALQRDQAFVAFKARIKNRQAEIGARSSRHQNMNEVRSAILAPRMSFDLIEHGEEDDAGRGEGLEVSGPPFNSRRSLLDAQLQQRARTAKARAWFRSPPGASLQP
ncbi:unnamed protein product, partial [Polarella glacialis]